MILNPKTSQETLNKYPDEEARMAAQQRACIMGGMALVFLDTLGLGKTVEQTLEHPNDCTRGNCTDCESVNECLAAQIRG